MKPLSAAFLLLSLSACTFNNPFSSTAEPAPANLPPAATAQVAAGSGVVGDELLSAQAAYREAIRQQNRSDGHIASLQRQLHDAERRKQQADDDITRLRAELHQASESKTGTDSATQAASQRLNTAWEAARQAGLVH
ncbi:hypothetical protein [Neisseria wadsworthii]|uniref:hypothetical protein n=1 Tax=Neisseria wadsworthii TaxID=607711 RepID=UPI000D31E02F|nr:hypothetical protein [Neisseria wadsworthii]